MSTDNGWRSRGRSWGWWLYLSLGVLAAGGYSTLPSGTTKDAFFIAVGLSAAAAVVAGVLVRRPSRSLPWYLVAAGLLLVVAGDAVVFAYLNVLRIEYPFPSVADALYVGAYPVLAAGMLLMRGKGLVRKVDLIDPLILATGAGVLYWVFLLGPVADTHNLSIPQRLVDAAYPLADVLLLAVLARFLLTPFERGVRPPACYLVTAALVLLLAADVTNDALALAGVYEVLAGVYEPAALVDAGWLVSYALFGAAALHPSMVSLSEAGSAPPTKLTLRRLIVLAGTALLTPGVLAVQELSGRPIEVPVIVGASVALFVLVAARMGVMIGEREALERRLAYQAYHDPLTGLPNRRLFVDRLEHELARAARQGRQVAVLFVDLDDFKPVNDTLGHAAGDRLLVAVGKRLLACLRPADTAARLGGDEFAILIGDVGGEGRDATVVAERILQTLRMPFDLGGQEATVSASVGIVLSEGFADRPGDLLRKADMALYRAKEGRKGCCEVFGSVAVGSERLAKGSLGGMEAPLEQIDYNAEQRVGGK